MLAGSFFKLGAGANELRRIEHDDVELAAGGKHIADIGEGVGLREFYAELIEVGVFFGELQWLGVEIDADNIFSAAKLLGLNRKTAGVAAQVEHGFVGTKRGQDASVVA